VQRDVIESVAVKRTRETGLNGIVFRYTRISSSLFFGYEKQKGFFIAAPEKAFLDAMYLQSFGRYALDLAAIDAGRLDRNKLKQLSKKYPLKTQQLLKKNGYL
jgi:hypothetical protein